ncbi:hypothetical protein HDU84_009323 [Entophlyctis sp. JEL0112]|nr:hypothetical protein HDU84_009323 [Entophlyctis sp. JEL0112]
MDPKRVAVVLGASRGIGAFTAQALARAGCIVVLAGRTVGGGDSGAPRAVSFNDPASSLASVCAAINAEIGGPVASAVACDVCVDADIDALVAHAMAVHGRIDFAVYNSGAIFWGKVSETTSKRVNAVGLYKFVDAVLPIFQRANAGRFVVVSPPIYSRFFRGKTAYAMGKVAMTVLTHGLAMDLAEIPNCGVAITSLWPATAVQSAVTEVKSVPEKFLRHASIFADAVVGICNGTRKVRSNLFPVNTEKISSLFRGLFFSEPAKKVNGLALIDEDYLREFRGVTDFSKYRLHPDVEPPRMMPKRFPSLTVDEQDDRGFTVGLNSKAAKL